MPPSPQHAKTEPTINDVALAIVTSAITQAQSLGHAELFSIEKDGAASRDRDIATYICVAMANTPNVIKRISSCDGVHKFEVR